MLFYIPALSWHFRTISVPLTNVQWFVYNVHKFTDTTISIKSKKWLFCVILAG